MEPPHLLPRHAGSAVQRTSGDGMHLCKPTHTAATLAMRPLHLIANPAVVAATCTCMHQGCKLAWRRCEEQIGAQRAAAVTAPALSLKRHFVAQTGQARVLCMHNLNRTSSERVRALRAAS